jgi:hypothetical protein
MTKIAPHLEEYFQPRLRNISETKNASCHVGIFISKYFLGIIYILCEFIKDT